MNILVPRTMHLIGGVLLFVFVAAGCRTYGGYGSTEEMLEKIQQATQRFAEDYERAQGERDALRRAASKDASLAALAERFAAIVEHQGAAVEAQRALAAEAAEHAGSNILFAWVGPDSYRKLHRTYGAIITDQQIVQDRYGEVLRDVKQAMGASSVLSVEEQGRYQVAPHFYKRLEYAHGQQSVADILARARTAAPLADEATPDAEATTADTE